MITFDIRFDGDKVRNPIEYYGKVDGVRTAYRDFYKNLPRLIEGIEVDKYVVQSTDMNEE